MALVDDLLAAWRANAERWEPVAAEARALGLRAWNPGLYAFPQYEAFLRRFPPKKGALLAVGLNPSPHGMAQTGIPFTDCRTARDRLGLDAQMPGCAPRDLVPHLRKENGKWRLTYERSSLVLYTFLRRAWGDDRAAFAEWYMGNPCPLLFLDADGANVTPADPRLRKIDAVQPLRRRALEETARVLRPRGVVLLGADVAAAVGDLADALVGEANVVRWQHPARAAPEAWSNGLRDDLAKRGLLTAREA